MDWDGRTEISELDSVLDEENRDVVSHQVPITLVCVKFGCESTNITHRVGASLAALHGGKADEDRCIPRCVG